MLNFIFKWCLIVYKKYLLFSIVRENEFFIEFFAEDLEKNKDELLAKFNALKAMPEKHAQEMNNIQAALVKLGQIESRIKSNNQVKMELEAFIEVLKKS